MKTLLDELPALTLGYPIGNTLKIILYFLIPPVLLLVIYLNLILADIAVAVLHFSEDNPRWATSTIIILCWPALASFIFTIASPTLWPGRTPLSKENMKFLGIQLLHFGFFPFGVSYRYVCQIFWAIEATFASLRRDEIRREEALSILMRPNTMELYFFLQAYLHCAPQILLQFYVMLRIYKPYSDTVRTQLLSIAACLLKMAITTMSYQRFERRKMLGIEYPWTIYKRQLMKQYSEVPFKPEPPKLELISNFVGIDLNRYSSATTVRLSNQSPVHSETDKKDDDSLISKRPLSDASTIKADEDFVSEETVQIKKADEGDSDNEFYNDDVFHRVQSSPLPEYGDDYDTIQIENSQPKKKLRVSIVENQEVERRRQLPNKQYSIVDMSAHTTPPETPAPRMSFHVIKDKIVSNAETIMDKIPHRTYKEHVDIDLPVRVRQTAIKGIAQDDGIGKFVAFISWWLFLTARMSALATFSFFYFEASVYLIISHYILMVAILLCNSWKETIYRKMFYLFLGYIYLFCIIEFKMKFVKVRLWYGLYFTLVSAENFITLAVWFWTGTWDTWWFSYIAVVIALGTFLSYMSFLSYFLILKPRPITVYPLLSSQSLSPATI